MGAKLEGLPFQYDKDFFTFAYSLISSTRINLYDKYKT